MIYQTPRGARRDARLNRTVSAIALVSGLLGAVAAATPAAAQCVQGPPNTFTCSGQTDQPVIVGGAGAGVFTAPGFGVDTSSNGNAPSLIISGSDTIFYTDENQSALVGGGVWLDTTGVISAYATGNILADGMAGLRLQNNGGTHTSVNWLGVINNISGHGVYATSTATTGNLVMGFNTVSGREDGIRAEYGGTGTVQIQTTGPVLGSSGDGISIETGNAAGDLVLLTADVTGGSSGIAIDYRGVGAVSVNATGAVSGGSGTGIFVEADASSTDLSVRATSVSGGYVGIGAYNHGTGSTFVSATGPVTGGDWGVWAEGDADTTDMTVEVGDVSGDLAGIDVINLGSGFTSVRSTGAVSGNAFNGVSVEAGAASQGILMEAVGAYGDQHGIRVINDGMGPTAVRTTGDIVANFQNGIYIQSGAASGDVTVEAVDVQGRSGGVVIVNEGTGSTSLGATGLINAWGNLAYGIRVETSVDTTDLTVEVAAVEAGWVGIDVTNDGTGSTFVRSTDHISAGGFGIRARNGADATTLAIRTIDVAGGTDGIQAQNLGTGGTSIIATGSVTAQNIGIALEAGLTSGAAYIDANNVSGGASGIAVTNTGNGQSLVIVRGLVQGGDNGVSINSLGTQDAYLYNDGLVRNLSGLSSDLAVGVSGGTVEISNSGLIVGTVEVSASESLMMNLGAWDSAGGASQFTGADDLLVNADNGVLIARSNAATQDLTFWVGLERFENSGNLTLRDGGVGDVLATSADSVFSEGSTLAVDIGGLDGSDQFFTAGALELQEGARLSVNIAQPLTLNSQYVVAAAFDGLTGQFVFDDVILTAFAGLRDGYTAQTAYVEFVQLKALAEAGITPNQKAAAAGADSLPNGNPLKDALVLLPDEATAVEAFDQISGEVHPTARTAMVEDSRFTRDAVLDRLTVGRPKEGGWGRIIADDSASFGDFNAARSERDTHGLVTGVDRALGDNLIAGVAIGWTRTDLEIERRTSVAEVESVQAMAYVGGRFGRWGVRAGVGYGQASIETGREVVFPGFSAALDSDYEGSVLQGFVEAGYRMPAAGGHVEPFANLIALRSRTDAFAEATGPAALVGEAAEEDMTMSVLGVRYETNPMGGFSVRGAAGWRHAWGDLDPTGVYAFSGGAAFTVLGTALSEDAAVANLEAQWRLGPNVSVSVALDSVLGSDSRDHAITGGLRVVF